MKKTGFTLNTAFFLKGFARITEKTIPSLAEKGAYKVGAHILADAIKEEPRAPHLKGHLWRSQLVLPPKTTRGLTSVDVGFNVPYAARLHEAPANFNWTLEGSGPKFLESKLMKNKEKYLEFMADFIKNKGL